MLTIGLTGGIGSGKTTVAQIFEVLAIPVYYADQAAKDLMNHDPVLKEQIIAAFGKSVYREEKLDRALLAKRVFGDGKQLQILNSIVHPATMLDAARWIKKQHAPYVVKETAILFEAGLEKNYDRIIGVTAPESLRLERVLSRDHSSVEKVLQRMNQQMDEKEKMSRCHFVIHNDGIKPLLPQVLAIHESLLEYTRF
jgi:dephospho-CoA kinase